MPPKHHLLLLLFVGTLVCVTAVTVVPPAGRFHLQSEPDLVGDPHKPLPIPKQRPCDGCSHPHRPGHMLIEKQPLLEKKKAHLEKPKGPRGHKKPPPP